MTDPAPSNTRILLELDDARAERIRQEQALAAASRNANIGVLMVVLGGLAFLFTSWYTLSILLAGIGLVAWITGASGRAGARKQLSETDGKMSALKAQVK